MSVQRKRYRAEEKNRVAIEAIKGQKMLNELALEYGCIMKMMNCTSTSYAWILTVLKTRDYVALAKPRLGRIAGSEDRNATP